MFSPTSPPAINNCKIRLSLRKRQLLSQNPFKVNARKIFGKFNPLVSTFVSQHTILQRIELGSCEVRARVEHSSLQRSESRSEIMMLLRQLSYAIKNQLVTSKAQKVFYLLLAGSLWHKGNVDSIHGNVLL